MLHPEEYRSLFPILETTIHLGNCSQSPLSLPVMRAMEEYQRSLLEDGMDWPGWMEEVRQAKAAFAALIGASVEDIAVVSCVSDAVSTVASCLPVRDRTGIVSTVDEFPTVGHVWLSHAAKGRAEVVFARAPDGFYTTEIVDPYLEVDPAILSVHLVSYSTAALQDVRSLAELAHAHGALILVDAYQGLGTIPLDVSTVPLDIVVSGNLKYLLGLPGIAFMYVRPDIVNELEPAMTGWFGRANPFEFDATRLDFAPGARRFDMGTPPIPAAYAARAGMKLIAEVGAGAIRDHIEMLSGDVIAGAQERGLHVRSPLDPRAKGASTAILVGPHANHVEAAMRKRGVIVSARGELIRLAPHFFTPREDCEMALDMLSEVLDRTPARSGTLR